MIAIKVIFQMASGKTIQHALIIDDDPILCEVLRTFFETHGVSKISIASNGVEARNIFDQNAEEIDLISCDLHMPDGDGIEFMSHLKQAESQIPVLIVSSAHGAIVKSADALAKVYNLNLVGTMTKPVNLDELRSLLAPYLKA